MKRENIVIFGASGGGIKVAKTLKNLGVDFCYFVDNDSLKWGTKIEGKDVKCPKSLLTNNARIIIASNYQNEIEGQLSEMGIIDRLLLKEEIILEKFKIKVKNTNYSKNKEKNVIVELADAGICLGGIETWALMVTRSLLKKDRKVTLLTKEKEQDIPKDLEKYTKIINYDYERYKESIQETIDFLIDMLPCTVISNWQSQVMIAAIMVKKMYPKQMKIISVIHSDNIVLYRRQKYLEQYTDFVFCVSKKIRYIFEHDFHISANKLIYKESPVKNIIYNKEYTINKTLPIKIGYAGRISKHQKRADLLLNVIKILNEKNVNFTIEIAGDGTYFNKLVDETKKYKNVKLLGCIQREKIIDFWKDKDLFLSVSDVEGTSLSMLEAMSLGVVPIVTLVSGVKEFVKNDVNGYYSEIEDVDDIVKNIIKIEEDRKKLLCFGNICKKIIKERCNESDYIDVFEECIEN